jgi:AcrR family transcriptional regulator
MAKRPAEAPEGLRERKKAETRERLAATATALFRAQGYTETSVEQIAREAGVSLPTLFRYFPTKADLLFDGADAVVEEWRAAMRAGPPGETLGAALRRSALGLAVKNPGRGTIARLRAELAPRDPELRRKALEVDARVLGRVAEVMGELLGLDPLDDPRPFLLASCGMAAVRSAQHVVGHQRRRVDFAARLDESFDALESLHTLLRAKVSRV